MIFWSDPVNYIAEWMRGILTTWGLSESYASVLVKLVGAFTLIIIAMVLAIALVWFERKIMARFQGRLGPNRLGPFGIFQPFADIIKLIVKEDSTPALADKVVYNIAPVLSATAVILLWAILPVASNIVGVDLNVAVLYLVAAGALGTLAVIMAGWSSNNKYALLGAFRLVATMISYEIPMVISLLVPTILAGTMSVQGITQKQGDMWFVFLTPLGMLIFMICVVAELGRQPFDLAEADSEIVAGYNIEYAGMKFGWFYAGELLHAFTFGGFMAVLFFGGYGGFFGLEKLPAFGWLNMWFIQVPVFLVKAFIGYWIIIWIKFSLPRVRIDQILAFNWKFLTPLAFILLITTALLHKLLSGMTPWIYNLSMFTSNILIALIAIEALRIHAKRRRKAEEVVLEPLTQNSRS